MENIKCHPHGKKCKTKSSIPHESLLGYTTGKSAGGSPPGGCPVYGKQGQWTAYKQYSPLPEGAGLGYKQANDRRENWEDVLVASELTHAKELKTWAERLELLDRAYQSKYRRLEQEYQQAVESGFEEAYQLILNEQRRSKEREAHIACLEARVQKLTQEVESCRKVVKQCCPDLLACCGTACCEKRTQSEGECHGNEDCSDR